MGCPIHVWLPLMAAAAPVGRIVRDRVRDTGFFSRRRGEDTTATSQPAPERKRWAPVGASQQASPQPPKPATE